MLAGVRASQRVMAQRAAAERAADVVAVPANRQRPGAISRPTPLPAPQVLAVLQRRAGNAAVARLVTGRPAPKGAGSAGADTVAHLSSPRFKGDQVLEACFDDRARLGIGSTGPAVQKLQQALLELGLTLGAAGADGRYGPATAEAVKAFKRQEQLGFEQFGDVGPGTMHRLDRMFAEDTAGPVPAPADVRAEAFAFGERDAPAGEPFIEAPLAPPQALTVPPNEGDCEPPIAATTVAFNDTPVDAGGSGTAGDARGLPPCDVAPAPPGAISDFEEDLRTNPGRISAVVVDPESQEIIGYRVRTDSSVLQLVDREGNFVAGNEKSLDQPLVDPIDFIPTPGAAVKGAAVVGKVGLKALGKFVAKGGSKEGFKVAASAIPRLRSVSQAMIARAARAATKKFPTIARNITIEGLNHSFDRHAAQFFGRTVSRETHFQLWRGLVERGVQSTQVFPWTLGANRTIAHLTFIEGKPFVVHFFEESGNLASAFVPSAKQLRSMLRLIALAN